MTEITPAQKSALLKLEGFKEIQKQYAKENKMVGSGKRKMKGKGFWQDVGDWFSSVGTSVNDFLKRTKLISNVAGAVLPLLAPLGTALLTANPIAAAASVGAAKAATEGIKSLGYGYVNTLSKIGSKKMKGSGVQKMAPSGMLVGRGPIYSQNGMLVPQPVQSGGRGKNMMGGATTQYNVVSTAPSKVAF